MQYDSIAYLACVDCSVVCRISFGIVMLRGKELTLTMYARCLNCYKQNDKRSLRATISLPRKELLVAINNGLPVLEVA